MDELQLEDVPYGNDWDSAEEVAAWAEEADRIRPWRAAIRDHIARRVATLPPGARVLELGSGPGFLAHRVLQRCPSLEGYTLLDFSEPMLALSQERLAMFPVASFVLASSALIEHASAPACSATSVMPIASSMFAASIEAS